MKPKMPNSPFATRLSSSAKETELRIRNIFQWKKKRPPFIALAAALLVVAVCGSLVGFNTAAPESAQPQISMDVQYYDTYENYIEIPMLVPPDGEEANEAIAAINQALAALKGEYQTVLNGAVGPEKYGLDGIGNHCLFYPTTTDRYINLLFFREIEVTDLNTGHVFSLVYDKEEKRQVTMEDALALAGLTEQELYDALSAQYDPQHARELPDAHVIIQNQSLEGFRMGADGNPIFYLTARSDDADDTVQDYVSGADNLYIWSDGAFARYDQYTVTDLKPLVPAGETVKLDPPLWCQWYFESGEPEGGFTTPENTSTIPSSAPGGAKLDESIQEAPLTQKLMDAVTYVTFDSVNPSGTGTLQGYFPVSRVEGGVQLLTGSTWYQEAWNSILSDMPEADSLSKNGSIASNGTWDFFPVEVEHKTYTLENQPEQEEWLDYFRQKLAEVGSQGTPVVITEAWLFDWNGTKTAVVNASNVIVSDDDSLYVAGTGGEHAEPNLPSSDHTGMYKASALFTQGNAPVDIVTILNSSNYSEIQKEAVGLSYLPPEDGSYQQLFSTVQYDENGNLTVCQLFCDDGTELNTRQFRFSPAVYLVCDMDGDGEVELISGHDAASSLMRRHSVYKLIDGKPECVFSIAG